MSLAPIAPARTEIEFSRLTIAPNAPTAPVNDTGESLLTPVPGQTEWWQEPREQRAARMAALLPFASDPTLPAATLGRIAQTAGALWHYRLDLGMPEQEVLNALAANPNTPPEVLAHCACISPEAFCRNPVAPLLPLESPGWARELPCYGMHRLLRRPDIPTTILAAIASERAGDCIGEAARLHVALGGEVSPGEGWQGQVRGVWRACGNEKHLSTKEKRRRLHEMMALDLAAPLPPEMFEEAEFLTYRDSLNTACDPETDEATLKTLARGNGWIVRLAIVLNPGTPKALRSQHQWRLRRRSLAWDSLNSYLDNSTFEPLLRTKEEVRAACRDILRQTLLRASYSSPLFTFLTMAHFGEPLLDGAKERRVTRRQRRAADSDDWRERLGAVLTLPGGCHAGRALLALLLEDANRLVRAAARARLAEATESASAGRRV